MSLNVFDEIMKKYLTEDEIKKIIEELKDRKDSWYSTNDFESYIEIPQNKDKK